MVTVAVVKCIYENHLHPRSLPASLGITLGSPCSPWKWAGLVFKETTFGYLKTFYFTNMFTVQM